MSEFATYFWKLLNRPFKLLAESDVGKWVTVLGELFDDLKQTLFKVRRLWVVATSSGPALDLHGAGRRLPRFPGEKDEYYNRRVLGAFEIYQAGGTRQGALDALTLLGYPNSQIYEVIRERIKFNGKRKYDKTAKHGGRYTHWSQFDVIIGLEQGRQFTPADLAVLIDSVYRMKSGHTKPRNLIIGYGVFYRRHNGQYRYNRAITHDPAPLALDPYYQVAGDKITLLIKDS